MPVGENKPIPRNILVFGAATRVGRALARQVAYERPDITLRLASTNADKLTELQSEFPGAEYVEAHYLDRESLRTAVAGMEGIFVVTPSVFDERKGMQNLADAVVEAGSVVHMVRLVGYDPGAIEDHFPAEIADIGSAKHYVAKRVLDAARLPVTYLNAAATFTDNYLYLAELVRKERRFVHPNRLITHIDSRDVGELGAKLLMSTDERHVYQVLSVNNGQDIIDTHQAAAMLSDVLKVPLEVDTSEAAYTEMVTPMFEGRWEDPAAGVRALMRFFEFEASGSGLLSLTDRAERILGRKPLSVYAWFREHKQQFLA